MEVLNTVPDIISISQEYVPTHLKGHTLVFYIKEQDRAILAGWGEHTPALANLIREYLEIPTGDYGMVDGVIQELGLPGTVLEIYHTLDRIYQDRSGEKLETKF